MPRLAAALAHSTGSPRDQVQFGVAFKIVLAGRLWRARFAKRMKALHQTDARWSALYMIADAANGINQSHIAERLGVQGPTLVRLLDALESEGLVSRHPDPDDRRAKLIWIEEKGRKVLAEVDRHAAAFRNELFEGVSDADLKATLRVLRRLTHQLDPHAASMVSKSAAPATAEG